MRPAAVRLSALVSITVAAIVALLSTARAEISRGTVKSQTLVPAKKTLNLAGIFPISGTEGWQGGQACLPAAQMAEEDVNAREDLLAGYTLHMTWNDSKCEPGLGARVMYDLLYNKPQKLMLIGGCSTVCTTIAEAARMWNLMVLSYGSSSPALSDRKRFPTFFRTHPSATVHNPTRIKLFQLYGWTRIAILQQAEEVFISTVKDMEERCKQAGIEILTRQSFLTDPAESVKNLRRPDARIVVGLFYVAAARRVLCDIYKQKMYGKSYVWLFIGWYEDNWFEVNLKEEGVNCTREQMAEAAEGHITTEALMWDSDNSTTISGMTTKNFEQRLKARLKSPDRIPDGYQEAPLAYDAIWAIALALNKTASNLQSRGLYLENFTYTHKEIADAIKTAMEQTSFQGISGLVKFSTKGDRLARTQFEQLQDGKYVRLGFYDTNTDNFTQIAPARWIGNKVPQDRTIVKVTLRTVSLTLFVLMCCLSLLGLAVAVGLLCFNYIYRERRLIRHSHPVGNDMTLVGICLCLLSVVLLGLDGRFVPEHHYHVVCQIRTWTLSIGFTLSFGAMFTKIWRVHRFATKAEEKIKVQPRRLYILVGCLLLVDVAFLITWQIMDPLYRDIESFPLEDPPNSHEDMKFKPLLEHCYCKNLTTWLGILYGFKGLLLIFGLFLAYETRSIKLKEINDSRLVGMSIYNVVVLCLITAPVSMVIGSQQDASFAFVALAIVFCCYISMGLIFFPKIMDVIHNPRERVDPSEEMPSREEEERYRKLLSENDELQRLIAEKEEKVRLLRQKLQERAAARTTGGAVVAAPALGLVAATRMLDPGQPLGGAGPGPSVSRRPSAADRRPSATDRRPRVTVVCATPPPGCDGSVSPGVLLTRPGSPRAETPDGPCFSIAVPRPGEGSTGSTGCTPSPEPERSAGDTAAPRRESLQASPVPSQPSPATSQHNLITNQNNQNQSLPVTNPCSPSTTPASPASQSTKQANSVSNRSSPVPLAHSPVSLVPSPVPSHQDGLDVDVTVTSPNASPVPPGISVLGIIAYTKGPRNPATGDFDPSESYL